MRSLLALFTVAAAIAAVGLIFGRPDAQEPIPDPMVSDGQIIGLTPECARCRQGTCRLAGFRQAQPAKGR